MRSGLFSSFRGFGALPELASISGSAPVWSDFNPTFDAAYRHAQALSLAVDNIAGDPAAGGLAAREGEAKAQITDALKVAQVRWSEWKLAQQATAAGNTILNPLRGLYGRAPEFEAAWKDAMARANHYAIVVYGQEIANAVQAVKNAMDARLITEQNAERERAARAEAAGAIATTQAAEQNVVAIQTQRQQLVEQTDLEALAKKIAAPKIFGIPIASILGLAVVGVGGYFGYRWWKKRKAKGGSLMPSVAGYRRRRR